MAVADSLEDAPIDTETSISSAITDVLSGDASGVLEIDTARGSTFLKYHKQ